MKSLQTFRVLTDGQSENYLASFLPKGRLFAGRFDANTNIYKLLKCLANFLQVVSGQIYNLVKNIIVDSADELMTEWLTSVKIPEKFPALSTIALQKHQIKRLLSKNPVYNINGFRVVDNMTTIEDFILKLTGITITVTRKVNTQAFPLTFPIFFHTAHYRNCFVLQINVMGYGTSTMNAFPATYPISFVQGGNVPQDILDLITLALDYILPAYVTYYFVAA